MLYFVPFLLSQLITLMRDKPFAYYFLFAPLSYITFLLKIRRRVKGKRIVPKRVYIITGKTGRDHSRGTFL